MGFPNLEKACRLDEATFVNTMEEGVRQLERSALMECDRGSPSSAATFPATSVSSVASTAKPATLAATASEKEVIFFKEIARVATYNHLV